MGYWYRYRYAADVESGVYDELVLAFPLLRWEMWV